jgi:hypothetical protein
MKSFLLDCLFRLNQPIQAVSQNGNFFLEWLNVEMATPSFPDVAQGPTGRMADVRLDRGQEADWGAREWATCDDRTLRVV